MKLLSKKFFMRIFIFVAILILFLNPVAAYSKIEVNPINSPNGIVILIIDGLGSTYIYPQLTPYAMDGSLIIKPKTSNISLIINNNMQVLTISTLKTYTEGGHAILVTGYSNANVNTVGFHNATIFDATRNNNFLNFAILHKGDSRQMRNEQHLIIHCASNSINNPDIRIEKNHGFKASTLLYNLIHSHKNEKRDYIHTYPERSIERYNAYNRWGIKVAKSIMRYMNENQINQRYILTMNLGAIDSAGQSRGVRGYVESIESLDKMIMPLYNLADEHNLAFILTADHGMAFRERDSRRGGHKGPDFTVTNEAQKIPFIISAPTVKSGKLKGNFGQRDIAPTLLDLLDIHDKLRFQDGSALPIESFISIKLSGLSKNNRVELIQNEKIIAFGENDNKYLFSGVKPQFNYVLRITESGRIIERQISTNTDISFDFSRYRSIGNESIDGPIGKKCGFLDLFNIRYIIGFSLISIIGIIGFVLIFKILKQKT